ncbi:MAG: hypothetical protein ACRDNF_02345 [Streptosporangiaceae bacterium]
MRAADPQACELCEGRGWKFLLLRRSSAHAGDVSEQGLAARSRVRCLDCDGTGKAQA